MRGVFPETPLQKNEHLSALYDADIWLKREDLSPVRSYKLRGAFNAMRKVAGETHFVCASAGNHAQGVAYMCRHMNVQGTIFMPVTTPQQKIQKTKMFGGGRGSGGGSENTGVTECAQCIWLSEIFNGVDPDKIDLNALQFKDFDIDETVNDIVNTIFRAYSKKKDFIK